MYYNFFYSIKNLRGFENFNFEFQLNIDYETSVYSSMRSLKYLGLTRSGNAYISVI